MFCEEREACYSHAAGRFSDQVVIKHFDTLEFVIYQAELTGNLYVCSGPFRNLDQPSAKLGLLGLQPGILNRKRIV